MQTEKVFILIEYYNDELADFTQCENAAHGWDITNNLVADVVRDLIADDVEYYLSHEMETNGDFIMTLTTDGETLQFEGFTKDKLIH